MEEDRLDGFREATPEDLEAGLRRNLGVNEHLVDVWQMGKVMAAFADTPAGCYLVKTLKDELADAVHRLFAEAAPDTEVARLAFFEAKARLTALDVIESAVKNGADAERRMIDDDEVTP